MNAMLGNRLRLELRPGREVMCRVAHGVRNHLGIEILDRDFSSFERQLATAAQRLGFKDRSTYESWLRDSSDDKQALTELAKHITIGETYFFRQPEHFEFLKTEVFRRFAQSPSANVRPMRIWSAGCATGEEAYSISVLAARSLHSIPHACIDILATDVNQDRLDWAIKGQYTRWSFRNTPDWFERECFSRCGDGRYAIHDRYREPITFRQANLADGVAGTGPFDVIFCRNVLLYFSNEQALNVLEGLYSVLNDGGWLFLGASDFKALRQSSFAQCVLRSGPAIIHKTDTSAPAEQTFRNYALVADPAIKLNHSPERPVSSFISRSDSPNIISAPQNDEQYAMLAERLLERCQTANKAGRSEDIIDMRPEIDPILSESRDPKVLAGIAAELGQAYANYRRFSEALPYCERAVSLDKTNPRYPYLAALVLAEAGELEDAKSYLRRVLYLDPAFVMALVAWGSLHFLQSNHQEMRKCYARAREILEGLEPEAEVPDAGGLTASSLLRAIDANIALGHAVS